MWSRTPSSRACASLGSRRHEKSASLPFLSAMKLERHNERHANAAIPMIVFSKLPFAPSWASVADDSHSSPVVHRLRGARRAVRLQRLLCNDPRRPRRRRQPRRCPLAVMQQRPSRAPLAHRARRTHLLTTTCRKGRSSTYGNRSQCQLTWWSAKRFSAWWARS